MQKKKKGYMAGQVRKDELLAKRVAIGGRREWCDRFCSETNVWTKAKCRRCKTDIPAGLHGKHLQAVSTRNWHSFVIFANGKDHVLAYKALWTKETGLRELREEINRLKSEGK